MEYIDIKLSAFLTVLVLIVFIIVLIIFVVVLILVIVLVVFIIVLITHDLHLLNFLSIIVWLFSLKNIQIK